MSNSSLFFKECGTGNSSAAANLVRLVRAVARRRGVSVPGETDIRRALHEARFDSTTPWTNTDLTRFVAALFPNRNASPLRRAAPTLQNCERKLLESSSSPVVPLQRPNMIETVAPVSYLVSIDSSDRDKSLYLEPNQFAVKLGTSDTSGPLRAFVDVQKVELVSVIVPQHTVDGDNVDDFPFLLLEIPEIGGIYEGTNMHTTRAFAKLRFADNLGAYREYRTTDKGERFVKYFNPIRSLDRITIRFLRPDGTLYDFGTRVKRRPRYATVRDEDEKEMPMYFDGESWLPVHTDGTCASKKEGTISPDILEHLPLSECALVLRVTCLEMQLNTSHLHRQ